MDIFRSHVLICGGSECTASESQKIIDRMNKELTKASLDKEVKVIETDCFGLCDEGPNIIVYPQGSFYSKVTVGDVSEIVQEHLLNGRIVKRLLYKEAPQNVEMSLEIGRAHV